MTQHLEKRKKKKRQIKIRKGQFDLYFSFKAPFLGCGGTLLPKPNLLLLSLHASMVIACFVSGVDRTVLCVSVVNLLVFLLLFTGQFFQVHGEREQAFFFTVIVWFTLHQKQRPVL